MYDVGKTQQIVDKLVKIAKSKFGEPFTVTIDLWNDDTFQVGVKQTKNGIRRLSYRSSTKNCVFEIFQSSYGNSLKEKWDVETIDIN
jgi:hypothetical protein